MPGFVLKMKPAGLSLEGSASAVVGLYVPTSDKLSPNETTCVTPDEAGGETMTASVPSSLHALRNNVAATANTATCGLLIMVQLPLVSSYARFFCARPISASQSRGDFVSGI